MKREILCRGLRADGKGWVEGAPFFVEEENTAFIIDNCYSIRLESEDSSFTGFKVIPESVGRYTGKDDMKGTKIFEDDKIEWRNIIGIEDAEGTVYFDTNHSGFCALIDDYDFLDFYSLSDEEVEVIGNIHEN